MAEQDEEALYQRFKERLLKDLPPAPTPWWQDADKLIKVIGAIGILAGVIFTGFQSYFAKTQSAENAVKLDSNHAAATAKLEEVKTATVDQAKKLDSIAPKPK